MNRARKRIRYYGPGVVALVTAAFLLFAGPVIVTRMGDAQRSQRVQLARTELAESELLASLNESMQNVARAVEASVVHITVANVGYSYRLSSGSGWVYDDLGHIVTNHHVVGAKDGSIEVQFHDGARARAILVGSDEATDVAVIQVVGRKMTPAKRANEYRVAQGDLVFAFGSPFGFQFSMNSGIISGQGRFDRLASEEGGSYQSYIQTDAAINPGNSGGPLTNMRGEVIGMNFAMAVDPQSRRTLAQGQYVNSGVGLAIPLEIVEAISDQLIATGKVERGGLGLQLNDLDLNWQTRLGFAANGVRITSVMLHSPAEAAGVKRDDIIMSVDGKAVSNVPSFRAIAHAKSPGEQVVLGIWRESARIEIAVILNRWDDVQGSVGDATNSPLYEGVEFSELGLVALRLGSGRLGRLGFDAAISEGLFIQALRLDSVGSDLGFRAGTLVVAADGEAIAEPEQLRALLESDEIREAGVEFEVVDIGGVRRLIRLLVPRVDEGVGGGGG